MKNTIQYIFFCLVLVGMASCEKVILEEAPANDPISNFEIFWEDFDKHYALFDVKQVDWKATYNEYRPKVTATTTDKELWTILTTMIDELDDGHTFLLDRINRQFFGSGDSLNRVAIDEFSLDLVYQKHVDLIADLTGDGEFSYGQINQGSIGYIYLGAMDDTDPSQIDNVVQDLENTNAIILDTRNNGGGRDAFSARIANAFADGEHFIYTVQNRNGPNHNDFETPRKYFTSVGKITYTKPVILLTDRYCASAGEIFGLHMNAFKHVIQMGDYTAGDYSDTGIRRFLPNGWEYQYSIQKFLLPDGTSLEGIGNKPDVFVKNTIADIQAGNDLVMERALQYLVEQYGIQ